MNTADKVSITRGCKRVSFDRKGVTAVSYALIISGVSLAILSALSLTGKSVNHNLCTASSALTEQTSSDPCYKTTEYDWVNASFLPSQFGGQGVSGPSVWHSEAVAIMQKALGDINSVDPVLGIYGLYDSNSNPATKYSDAEAILNSGNTPSATNDMGNDSYATMYQFKTASGTVYNMNGAYVDNGTVASLGYSSDGNDGFSFQIVNSKTNAVVETLYKNGSFADNTNIWTTGYNPQSTQASSTNVGVNNFTEQEQGPDNNEP